MRECPICSKDLTGEHRRRKYCCDAHALFGKYNNTVKFKCRGCKEIKDIYVYHINKEKGNYCDRKCAAKYREINKNG